MRYVSTNGRAPAVDLATALLQGLASDGGLYLPETLERLPASVIESLPGGTFAETSFQVGSRLLANDLEVEDLLRITSSALDFPVPLIPLEPNLWLLELFHGPTCAFKDVGARFLARALSHLHPSSSELTILVATSGDTGSAVAQAFLGLAGIRVVVLYPDGLVSRLQEAQFATLGDNVTALAIKGTFDDCQRLVKMAFNDAELRREQCLTSANSINVGRLLPQTFYYFHAMAQLPAGAPPPVISTPSGNFGNLTAGLMAKKMGLKVSRFVAATNINDTVPEYLRTGIYEPKASVRTLSNAMDVGAPSNFARMQALYGHDLEAMRRDVVGSRHDDQETRACIRETYERYGKILDPHTAVGLLGLRRVLDGNAGNSTGVVLATAHPGKFREQIEPILGKSLDLPESLARCDEQPILSRKIPASFEMLRDILGSGSCSRDP